MMSRLKLAVVAAFLVPQLAFSASQVTHLFGEVRVRNSKGIQAAVLQQNLNNGDAVLTGPKSLAIVSLDGGGQLKVNADSEIVVAGAEEAELKSGSAFSRIISKAKGKTAFRLRTRAAVMGVRGTEFFTSYGRNQDVWMCVNEGEVEVEGLAGAQSAKVLVRQGEGVLVPSGKDPTAPKPYGWTRKLNWNMEPEKGEVVNSVNMGSAYRDLLDQDYD